MGTYIEKLEIDDENRIVIPWKTVCAALALDAVGTVSNSTVSINNALI